MVLLSVTVLQGVRTILRPIFVSTTLTILRLTTNDEARAIYIGLFSSDENPPIKAALSSSENGHYKELPVNATIKEAVEFGRYVKVTSLQ